MRNIQQQLHIYFIMTYTLKIGWLGAAVLATGAVYAQSPSVIPVDKGIVISAISDNGKYAVSSSTSELEEGGIFNSGGKLWDLSKMTGREVTLPSTGMAGVFDVTDDGNTVVGSYNNIPAYWNATTGEWTQLPLPQGCIGGQLLAVTPDGTKAVGFANITSDWDAQPVCYSLTDNALVSLANVPVMNMNHEKADFSSFCAISADGRYILGRLSQEVLMPVSMCAYVYDTATSSVDYIGFSPSQTTAWKSTAPDCLFIDDALMSPDGTWVTGAAYMSHPQTSSDWNDEYYVAYRYNVKTKKTEIYDGPYDGDIKGNSIANDGTVFACSPADSPYASMMVRKGNYYYSLADIFSNAYSTDFYTKTGYPVTGKPISCSADGMTLAMLTGPSECYILKMGEEWSTAASKVNLLGNYTTAPSAGAAFANVTQVTITFTRNIDVAGAASRIKLLDDKGEEVRSAAKAEADNNKVTVSFRKTALDDGRNYTVHIPSGLITMVDDISVTCDDIDITYTGRAEAPVEPLTITPVPGSAFARIDSSTQPVSLRFDTQVSIASDARALLRRKGEEASVADLYLSLYDPYTVLVYPLSRQYLFEGSEYEVVIPAGALTDLSGASANDGITIGYRGTYVREVSTGDRTIFSDDCSNYDGFMFYEGDHLVPASTPAGWGFGKDNPWYIVRSSEATDEMALGAHSMFADGGTSDDWMCTPQLYIPDGLCYLTFDAQSYKSNKSDRLKVYALPTEKVISTLTAADIADFRSKGEVIFDGQLYPGSSEEELEGDWQSYTVKLPQFAGQTIYLAFVNENTDQSAIFINRVEVVHDIKFLLTATTPSATVNAENVAVTGTLTVASDILRVTSLDLTLKDSAGKTVSTLTIDGLDLGKGQTADFKFPTPLALEPNEVNAYAIEAIVNKGEERTTMRSTVKNLAFMPTRRIFIEEYSGRECSNCPLGFLAMDNLQKLFPGQIIPAVIRTFQSDPLGSGLGDWTQYLGLDNIGAPSATINRTLNCFPMTSVGLDYHFSGEGLDEEGEEPAITWLDAVATMMQTPADCDVELNATYDGATGTVTVDGTAQWAVNTPALNANVLTVITEDNVETLQMNNLYTFTDPDLGQWGAGGLYSQQVAKLAIDHVARGCFGMTFNGSHILPSSAKAAEEIPFHVEVTMPQGVDNATATHAIAVIIDGDTDRVINCASVPVTVINAIDEAYGDADCRAEEYYDLCGRRLKAPAAGQINIVRKGTEVKKIKY